MSIKTSKSGRIFEEKIIDRFLVLFTIHNSTRPIGDTMVQKLTFLSALDMKYQGRKGFNYNFIKLDFGPYSSDLKDDIQVLLNNRAINGHYRVATKLGEYILSNFSHIIDENSIFFEKIENINQQYSHWKSKDLVRYVHRLKNPEHPRFSIHNTRQGSYILRKPKVWRAEREFSLSESDMASLEIYLDPETFHRFFASIEEAKQKPAVELSEVLDSV